MGHERELKTLLVGALLGGALVGLLWPSPADACLHASVAHPVPVSQRGQQGLILFRDGVEELVLGVEASLGGEGTESLAWVIPVPSAPTSYATADAALFDELHEWVRLTHEPIPGRARAGRGGGSSEVGVERLPPASVGPYDIQPVRAHGAEAARALNEWMTSQGFAPLPDATLAYYVERGWTFLAVKMNAQAGLIAGGAGLPPVRIRFPSDRIVYPLKLSTHMGHFPVRLYVITEGPLPVEAWAGARERGFTVAGHRRGREMLRETLRGEGIYVAWLSERRQDFGLLLEEAPPSLQAILREAGVGPDEELTMRVALGNVRGQDIAEWDEDLMIPALESGGRSAGADTPAAEPIAGPSIGLPTTDAPAPARDAAAEHAEEPSSVPPTVGLMAGLLALALILLAWRRARKSGQRPK